MDFRGEFEIHLTIATERPVELLRNWAAARHLKFSHILLDAGQTPSQPMVTVESRGTQAEARGIAAKIASDMAASGFTVVRTKIEASPRNVGVPQTASQVEQSPPGAHFEHHVKILLPVTADVAALRDLTRSQGGHLSLNARRMREGSAQERFVTQRCYGVSLKDARRQLARLLRALRTAPVDLLEVEQEYVVFDSHVDLDRGWITEGVS
jgi:hypothetical protein